MTRIVALVHEFVEYVPDVVNPGTLYVSIPFATAVHSCCCGCGEEVVTPISPTDWTVSFDGLSITLDPSIGNWSFACQSHYWIRRNRVVWARRWSREEVEIGRAYDRSSKVEYYGDRQDADGAARKTETVRVAPPRGGMWQRLWERLF
jgi:hypothetical protein